MRLLSVCILFFVMVNAKAQQPGTAPNLTPTEMNALVNTIADTELKNKNTQPNNPQQNPQPNSAPQSPAVSPAPAQNPTPAPTPAPAPMPAPAMNPAPTPQPINNNNYNGLAGRTKSPFMIPTELYNRVKQMQTVKTTPNEGTVDSQVDVRRRWPLRDYNVMAVMWDTKNPKAMISDREGKLHIFRVKDYIANSEGYVAEITNGEVIVVERGAEVKLKLKGR